MVRVSEVNGKFFATFPNVEGRPLSTRLPSVTSLAAAAETARLLASICFGARFGLPYPEVVAPVEPAVYFAAVRRHGGVSVKIGFARDVKRRLQQLQVCLPSPLVLLAWRPGGRGEEREEHEKWESLRERGEWFRLEGDLKVHMESLRRGKIGDQFVDLHWVAAR